VKKPSGQKSIAVSARVKTAANNGQKTTLLTPTITKARLRNFCSEIDEKPEGITVALSTPHVSRHRHTSVCGR
jgi:hypothetical protein